MNVYMRRLAVAGVLTFRILYPAKPKLGDISPAFRQFDWWTGISILCNGATRS